MDIIIALVIYPPRFNPTGLQTENLVSDPKGDEETEAADDLREIRTSDDVDEPDPEETDLIPLETDDAFSKDDDEDKD